MRSTKTTRDAPQRELLQPPFSGILQRMWVHASIHLQRAFRDRTRGMLFLWLVRVTTLSLASWTSLALAQNSQLRISVVDINRRPVGRIVIAIEGLNSMVTDVSGMARVSLPPNIRPGDPLQLLIVSSPGHDFVLISPWNGRVLVPASSSDAVIEVVVAPRGDRALLQNSQVVASLTARIAEASKTGGSHESSKGALSPEEEHRLGVLTVAREFGLSPEELNRVFEPGSEDQRRLAVVLSAKAFGVDEKTVRRALESLAYSKGDSTISPETMASRLGGKIFHIEFQDEIPIEFLAEKELNVNDQRLQVRDIDPSARTITVLGPPDSESPIHNGLNRVVSIASSAQKYAHFWSEERTLRPFESPYKNSYAVVAAIDDYDRVKDPLKRGKTGLRPLGGSMVANAKDLVLALRRVGFPASNIVTLFDEAATSVALNKLLNQFWKGESLESADRVFFYFGGHGIHEDQSGLLVTYDYDPKRPTSTSLLMKDLTVHHAENMKARHVLFALDACDAGLALTLGAPEPSEDEIRRLHKLSTIRSDVSAPGRNVLVAGTGEQKALWENGGVFTKALVVGLAGKADFNHDGIIEFDELALYVRQEVRREVDLTGVRQDPEGQALTKFGQGRIVFIPED